MALTAAKCALCLLCASVVYSGFLLSAQTKPCTPPLLESAVKGETTVSVDSVPVLYHDTAQKPDGPKVAAEALILSTGTLPPYRERVKTNSFVFPLYGPDAHHLCVRTPKSSVATMCEHIVPIKRRPLPQVSWDEFWSASALNAGAYVQRHKLCTVFGSSQMLKLYNYSAVLNASATDIIFAVNYPPPIEYRVAPIRVTKAWNHFNENQKVHIDSVERELMRSLIFTHWVPFQLPASLARNHSVADPTWYGIPKLKALCKILGVRYPGKYVSGIGVVMFAKHICERVQVLGFYGFPTYEHGQILYSHDKRHGVGTTKDTDPVHEAFMDVYLALHQFGQIDLFL